MKFYKNQIVTVSIEDMGTNGEGIGRCDGYTLFVKDALCGDVVRARLTKTGKTFAYARCEELITPSPDRTEPFCSEHKRCGGCQIQALSYEAQLKFKENKVKNDLRRIGGIGKEVIDRVMEPVIGMDDPMRYRNKSSYPVGSGRDGRPVTGFYAGRTHSIIPCKDCMISPEENKTILEIILSHMEKHHIPPYDETTGGGLLRHVLIRKGFTTGEIMVCLVINTGGKQNSDELIPACEELIESLRSVPGMRAVCASINNENTNVIMGNEIRTLWGSERITDMICQKKFEISPLSFFQINPVQVEKLYRIAEEFAALTGKEEVWDICCGIGTISLCLADKARVVHGLEIVPEAIEDARKNAVLNDISNADFICAAAEDFLPEHKDEIKADVIVLDPPRKGMSKTALEAIKDTAPDRIVYVSCDSATLARDLKYLTENGYGIERIRCVDMFPHTVHVECCVLLERVSNRNAY